MAAATMMLIPRHMAATSARARFFFLDDPRHGGLVDVNDEKHSQKMTTPSTHTAWDPEEGWSGRCAI